MRFNCGHGLRKRTKGLRRRTLNDCSHGAVMSARTHSCLPIASLVRRGLVCGPNTMANGVRSLSSLPSRFPWQVVTTTTPGPHVHGLWTLTPSSHVVVISIHLTLQIGPECRTLQCCPGSPESHRKLPSNLLHAGLVEVSGSTCLQNMASRAVRE